MRFATCRIGILLLCPCPAYAPLLGGPARASDVTVFAAASLKNALDDAVKSYETKTGRKFVVSYAASSALARQIEAGAPADIFFSADLDWMDDASKEESDRCRVSPNAVGKHAGFDCAEGLDRLSTAGKEPSAAQGPRPRWQARHGERRLRARGPVRQGGADVSRCVGCCRTTRGTSRQRPRGAGLRGKR